MSFLYTEKTDEHDAEKGRRKELYEKLIEGGEETTEELHHKILRVFNTAVLVSWPIFCFFLLSQPYMSNLLNNAWYNYSPEFDVYGDNGLISSRSTRKGMCDTPASQFHCTDGQNFTALAIKYRGRPFGCGCGQGVLGEGLCPMTSYGYTLSDYVSTTPSLAAMLGFSFFPIIGSWFNTLLVNSKAKPTVRIGMAHFTSMFVFQCSYIAWSMANDCIFPVSHAILTVVFLGSFLVHWIISAFICIAKWGFEDTEAKVTLSIAVGAVVIMTLGSIPRIFLTLNSAFNKAIFPNWNRGIGSYAFWFAEAAGLSLTFGAYPIILIAVMFAKPKPQMFRICFYRGEDF